MSDASADQSSGIDQVNKAIAEMDTVVSARYFHRRRIRRSPGSDAFKTH
ncbi:hypothetical protein [Desulfatiferula olefinivorans]